MDYMTLCKYTDNKKLYTLDDIIANFIDLDWFLKHVMTDIKRIRIVDLKGRKVLEID